MASEHFILVIRKHSVFGFLVYAYIAKRDFKLDCLSVAYMVTMDSAKDPKENLNGEQQKIVQLIEEYSERTLTKLFAKKKTPQEFIQNIDPKLVETQIRPYIERRLNKIFAIALNGEFDLFYCDKKTEHIYPNEKVSYSNQAAHPIFNFIKDADGLRYFLSISQEGKDINLFQKKGNIIISEPCLLLLENNIYWFSDIDGKKLNPFFAKKEIQVPPSAEQKYFETFILNSISQYTVYPTGFEIAINQSLPTPLIIVENSLNLDPTFCIDFKYGERVVKTSLNQHTFVDLVSNSPNYSYLITKRNIEVESSFFERLIGLGLTYDRFKNLALPNIDLLDYASKYRHTISWINSNFETLKNMGCELTIRLDERSVFIGNVSLNFRVDNSSDWFNIRGEAVWGEFRIPFLKLKKYIINDQHEFQLPNGEIAVIPDEWFARYKDIFSLTSVKNDTIVLKKHHFSLIDIFPEQEFSLEIKHLMDFVGHGENKKKAPDELNAELRSYQQTGYSWLGALSDCKLGGLLADDMGLGKTLQTIAALLSKHIEAKRCMKKKIVQLDLFSTIEVEEDAPSSLIVVPTSLLYNWANELAKFAPNLSVKIIHGTSNRSYAGFCEADVYITTYGMIRNDLDNFKAHTFLYLVLDESQYIKNPSSKIFQSVIELKSTHKISLSGTPIENSLTDLWAQMSFLNPGILGTQRWFEKEYVSPIQKDNNTDTLLRLRKLITPFILRRTKDEVCIELPPVTTQICFCEMAAEQKKFYEVENSKIRNLIVEYKVNSVGKDLSAYILKALMQLRQIANHPVIVDPEFGFDSGKFEEIVSAIDVVVSEGHKVLIFSSFVKHLELVETYIKDQGFQFAKITGQTQDRQQEVDRFQNEKDTKIFLISLKAGGTGLNLTAADYVFILDPWWNDAAEMQAISRAHRIGQTKNVFVYKFITKNSVEEKIMVLQQNKRTLSSSLIEGTEITGNLEMAEIIDLFESN